MPSFFPVLNVSRTFALYSPSEYNYHVVTTTTYFGMKKKQNKTKKNTIVLKHDPNCSFHNCRGGVGKLTRFQTGLGIDIFWNMAMKLNLPSLSLISVES